MLFPGDRVDGQISDQLSTVTIKGKRVESIRLGPGLSDKGEAIFANSAGHLQYRQPNKFWLETPSRRRYVPHSGDLVIGRVAVKTAEYLKVDLGGAHPAILPLQGGFEASTRRNRPNLVVGSLIYCRVSRADRFIEPEVLCVDSDGKANAFGELPTIGDGKGFMMFCCPVNVSWELQRPDCPILQLLGKHLPFEIVVGANGRYAIDSPSVKLTMSIHEWIDLNKADEKDVRNAAKLFANQ